MSDFLLILLCHRQLSMSTTCTGESRGFEKIFGTSENKKGTGCKKNERVRLTDGTADVVGENYRELSGVEIARNRGEAGKASLERVATQFHAATCWIIA